MQWIAVFPKMWEDKRSFGRVAQRERRCLTSTRSGVQIPPRPPDNSNRPNGRFFVYTLRAAHAPHLGFQAFARVPKPTKNASTAMQAASSLANEVNSSWPQSNTLAFFSPASTQSSSARPESRADATKMGAMMAEYHPSRAISKPKIHAVIEWTRIATGKAIQERICTFRSSPFTIHTMSRMLMTR